MYVEALKKGEGIGKDDLEKALNQTKKSQQIIEKILEQKVLDAQSKVIFAKGLPPYGKGEYRDWLVLDFKHNKLLVQ